jgi:nucleotide-binding universal stress UspA family protein
MSRIVVGYDGSDGSRASLERAIELAKGIGDSVTVVFGAAAPGIIGGEMASHEEAVAERGETVLRHATDQAQANGFEIEAKMVKEHPVDALLAEAEAGDARMIVVGNQGGPSPIRGAILGAVPFKLVHLSPVPVLVVPPG